MIEVNRGSLERVVGRFTWVEESDCTRIVLGRPTEVDERALLLLFPGYRLRDRGPVLELIPEGP